MENQHKLILGYRDLSEQEIGAMNIIKEHGSMLASMIDTIRNDTALDADPRWLSIGITHLQQGFMALTRAVAKPGGF